MIALFTDFGRRDAYVAQMKGAILGIAPRVTVLDLNHEVSQFNLRQAAYILDLSTRYFPAGSIFVVVVDPGVGTARRPLLVLSGAQHYYVGPDNGLLTHVLERDGLQAAYVLQQTAYFLPQVSMTFHGRDIFAPVAAHLASGVSPERFGPRTDEVIRLPYTPPQVSGETVRGEIVHLDHFGNVVTNIAADMLATLELAQGVSCTIGEQGYTMPFCATYGAGRAGQLLCLINSHGVFEVALPQGHAAAQLQASVGQRVILRRAG
jgi:hypothetical protein